LTVWCHKKRAAQAQAQAEVKAQAQAPIVQHESFPPLKWHRITHCQADASPSSSGRPQLHAPSFDSDLPLPFSIHQTTWIYLSCQGMHVLYHPIASLIMSFWIFMLGHIKIPMKTMTMTRILKMLLRRMLTQLIPELVTPGMKRMSVWKTEWIHIRPSPRFGIF